MLQKRSLPGAKFKAFSGVVAFNSLIMWACVVTRILFYLHKLCKENVNHSHTIDAKLYHSPPSPTSLIEMHLLESGHTDKLFRRRYLKQITVYPLTWWLVNFINDWVRIRQNGLNKQRCRSQKWDQKTPTTTSRSTPGSQQKSGVR